MTMGLLNRKAKTAQESAEADDYEQKRDEAFQVTQRARTLAAHLTLVAQELLEEIHNG
jgi:hypothetical protein